MIKRLKGVSRCSMPVMMAAMVLFFAQATPAPGAETLEGQVSEEALAPLTKCGIGRFLKCDIDHAQELGLFETGLRPVFPDHTDCRGIDEGYAINYSSKRDRENYHGGIDMPAPWGTPIIAAAAGTVVGRFRGERSFRGIEIVLRHTPEETGLPLWIYTQYTHFSEMPKVEVGQHVRMGEFLGLTGNSGVGRKGKQSNMRRPAIHFGVFYSTSEKFAEMSERIIPVDGWWMDPVALFRKKLPVDSKAMKALPNAEKNVPIAVMLDTGEVIPTGSKIVWPYTCKQK